MNPHPHSQGSRKASFTLLALIFSLAPCHPLKAKSTMPSITTEARSVKINYINSDSKTNGLSTLSGANQIIGKEGFLALKDPRTNNTFILQDGETYYYSYASELRSINMHNGMLIFRKPYFKSPTPSIEPEAALKEFSLINGIDWEKKRESETYSINLERGTPWKFFMDREMTAAGDGTPRIKFIKITGDILNLSVTSVNDGSLGEFEINLQTQDLTKAVVNGKPHEIIPKAKPSSEKIVK